MDNGLMIKRTKLILAPIALLRKSVSYPPIIRITNKSVARQLAYDISDGLILKGIHRWTIERRSLEHNRL